MLTSLPSGPRALHRLPAAGAATDGTALRAALARDGCLTVPGLLDPGLLRPLAREVAATFVRWGLADLDGDTLVWNGTPFTGRYDRPALHRLPALGAVTAAIEHGMPWQAIGDRLLGRRARVHRSPLLFAALPDDPAYLTPPHQFGFPRSDGGDPQLRIWLPLFPVAFGDGGLGVVPASHTGGRLPRIPLSGYRHRPVPGAAPCADPVDGVDLDDLAGLGLYTAAMDRGDALVFGHRTVHCGLPATSRRIRVAVAVDVAHQQSRTETRRLGAMAERRLRVRQVARALGMPREAATEALADLNRAGLDATLENIRAALAGRHSGWRRRGDPPALPSGAVTVPPTAHRR